MVAESRELYKEPVIHIPAFYPTNTCGHLGPHAPKVPFIYYISTFKRARGLMMILFAYFQYAKRWSLRGERGENKLKIVVT